MSFLVKNWQCCLYYIPFRSQSSLGNCSGILFVSIVWCFSPRKLYLLLLLFGETRINLAQKSWNEGDCVTSGTGLCAWQRCVLGVGAQGSGWSRVVERSLGGGNADAVLAVKVPARAALVWIWPQKITHINQIQSFDCFLHYLAVFLFEKSCQVMKNLGTCVFYDCSSSKSCSQSNSVLFAWFPD